MRGIALACVAAVITGCVGSSIEDTQTFPLATSKQKESAKPVQQGMNDFTFRLTKEVLKSEPGNVCISPLSISICLSTLLNGAQNQTFEDLRRTLSFDKLTLEQINDGNLATVSELLNASGHPFTIANSAWLKTDLPAKPTYIADLKKYYDAEFYGVPKFDASVVKKIDGWVDSKTKGRITKLFDGLDPSTVLVLANALTFDGDWYEPFDTKNTRSAPFHVNGAAEASSRTTMHLKTHAPFIEKDGLKALRLLYKGGEFSMVFVLPPPKTTAHDYLAGLTRSDFEALFKALMAHGTETIISLPKFKVEGNYSLKEPLSALGMSQLFVDADLGRIADGDFFVSQVVHRTYLKIDEKGTEAAAATGVAVGTAAMLDPPEFKADRPFVYFLVNDKTGTIIFLGICSDPS